MLPILDTGEFGIAAKIHLYIFLLEKTTSQWRRQDFGSGGGNAEGGQPRKGSGGALQGRRIFKSLQNILQKFLKCIILTYFSKKFKTMR